MLTGLRASPNDPNACLQFARQARHAGDSLSALEALKIAPRPDSKFALYILDETGRCYFELGLYPQALALYQNLLARYPQASQSYAGLSHAQRLLKRNRESMQTLDTGARVVPTDDIRGKMRLVAEFVDDAAYLPALAVAQTAATDAPDDPQVTLTLVNVLDKLQRRAEEHPLLDTLLAAHPHDAYAHYFLALLLSDPLNPQRDLRVAELQYLRALRDDPRNLPSFQHLGALYLEEGRYQEAAALFIRILQIAPDLAAARQQLAEAYFRLGDRQRGQEQWKIAQQLLERDRVEARLKVRRDLHASDPQTWLALGRHYQNAGQYTQALPVFQATYALAPYSNATRTALIALYARIGVTPPTLPERFP